MDLKKILYDMVCAIVDHPDQVNITETTEEDGEISFVLTVAEEDTGMVIGRHGKIARALRTVLKAAAGVCGKRVNVEIK